MKPKRQSSPGHTYLLKPLPQRFYKVVEQKVTKNVTNTVTYTIPVLRDFGGEIDPKKPWYIEYYYNGLRLREKFGINKEKNKAARYARAEAYRRALEQLLKEGFNPFEPTERESEVINARKRISSELPRMVIYKKPLIAHRTWQSYNSSVNRFVDFCAKQKISFVDEITKDHIVKYDYYLATEMNNSAKSRGNEIGNISAIMNSLVQENVIKQNPCFGVKRTKKSSGNSQIPWTKQEYFKLKDLTYTAHFEKWIFANFSYFCGLRPKETGLIKRSDLDLENQLLLINLTSSKTKHTDVVVIPDLFIDDLRRFCRKIPADHYLFSKGFKPGKESVHRNVHQRAMKIHVIDPGKFTKKIYQLKHTAGVLMKKSKFETQLIQAHYRHSSSATTEIYLSGLKNHIYQDLKTKFPDINDF